MKQSRLESSPNLKPSFVLPTHRTHFQGLPEEIHRLTTATSQTREEFRLSLSLRLLSDKYLTRALILSSVGCTYSTVQPPKGSLGRSEIWYNEGEEKVRNLIEVSC